LKKLKYPNIARVKFFLWEGQKHKIVIPLKSNFPHIKLILHVLTFVNLNFSLSLNCQNKANMKTFGDAIE
jgi:hypothetical protein